MKHSLLLTIAATLLGLTLAGCTDDIALNLNGQSQFDEGELVEAALAVNVTTFSVSNTRADGDDDNTGVEQPSDTEEPMTDFEKRVDNIWVFQYDTDGNLLIRPRYYTAKVSETDGTWSVLLKASVASKIYVVANVGNETWASAYEDFATEKQLLSQTLPSPYPVIPGTSEESAIPMEGVNDGTEGEGVTVSPEQTATEPVVVPVTRMYAKIKVKVNIDKELEKDNASVYNLTLRNIPWYCQVGTLYNPDDMKQSATYPDDTNTWITRAINEKNDSDEGDQEEGYDYVIYIPENIQGVSVSHGTDDDEDTDDDEEVDSNKDTKTENAPTNATRLTVRISYIDYTEEGDTESGVQSYADYTVCPGGNSVDNYNIRRNCVYRVTLNIGYPIEPSYQPSANCIYAAPGSTVYFEPYYRTEEGGGYNFEDYLDYTGEKGKQIKGVKILWQTKDCIGDNSSGNLVYFEPSESQPLHSRIYVTVDQPGNAVIAAYDKENPDAEDANIIWSWHIWVPDADEPDPTNEANGKLYYTYEWDSDSIYGLYSSRPRIPGYTIMDLNLGAMKSYPASSSTTDYVKCYGTMYQWGRKDPFPAFKGDAISGTISSHYGDYNESSTETLYDNDNATKIKITAMDDTAEGNTGTIYNGSDNNVEITIDGTLDDYLFHSVSGTTIENNSYGVAYSIAHPTIYMCGTNNYTLNSNTQSNLHNDSDWLPISQSDDRLWGATAVTDETKRYLFGTDNLKEDRHIYDNYGEKSIYDPCPYGWRTPPPDLWLGFSDTGTNPEETGTLSDHVNYSGTRGAGMIMYLQEWHDGETSYFPTQGLRTPAGSATHTKQCGSYNPASPDTGARNKVNMLHIHNALGSFHIFETVYLCYYAKSTAGPIRCVRETK